MSRAYRAVLCLFCALSFLSACEDGGSGAGESDANRGVLTDATPDGLPDVTGARCRLNSDCPPGLFCNDSGRCDLQCREDRDCLSERCVSGQCRDADPGRDMGRSDDAGGGDDCANDLECGDGRICERGECEPGCPERQCTVGLLCDRRTGRCVSQDCNESSCPAGERCDETSGVCVPEGNECAPGSCPQGTYCDAETATCRGLPANCRQTLCPAGFGCHPVDSRCIRLPEDCQVVACPDGFNCPVGERACVPNSDCRADGCPAGQRCDQDSGVCIEDAGDSVLGSDCVAAAQCASRLCVDVSVQGQNHAVCASPCCSEFDCPLGFGCRYTFGVGLCLPSRIYPAGYSFDAATGQACGPGARACQSGLCDLGEDRCIGVCCTDADCGGRLCQVRQVGEGSRAICGVNLIGIGRTGQGCRSELDCMSGLCVPVPGGVGGFPGQCADLCCTNGECGASTLCGQVVSLGGNIVSACVPAPPGPTATDGDCGRDEDCASGQCVEVVCREPCCRDRDCRGGRRCLPRPNDEGSFVRVCVPEDD